MCLTAEIIIDAIIVFKQNDHACVVVVGTFSHDFCATAIILLQKYFIIVNRKICHHVFAIRIVFQCRSEIYHQKTHRQGAQIVMQADNHLSISKFVKPKIHLWIERVGIEFYPFFHQSDDFVLLEAFNFYVVRISLFFHLRCSISRANMLSNPPG